MTDLLSPNDTGDIPVGEATRNLAPFVAGLPPTLRRPDATGEFPIVEPTAPARLVGAEELARLSAGETLVLPVGATPAEQPPPPRYQGDHRKGDPMWTWMAIGAGLLAFVEVAALAMLAVVKA